MSTQLDASVAKRLDITVRQGQLFEALLTFLDSDGEPVPLAGATAKMSVRQQAGCEYECGCTGDTPFDVVYKQDFTPTVAGTDNNQLAIEETVLLSPGLYKYDLMVVFFSGAVKYFLYGTFKVKKSYTKNDN